MARPAEQGTHILAPETANDQLLEASGVELPSLAVTHRDQDCHPIHQHPTGGEPQRVRRSVIEPLRVVHHHQHWAGVGRGGEHAEQRRPYGEPVPTVSGRRQTDRLTKNRRLVLGQPLEEGNERTQKLDEARVLQLRFGWQTRRPQDGHRLGQPLGVAEQGRLADPRFTAHHEHPCASVAGAIEQALDPRLLLLTPQQHSSTVRVPLRSPREPFDGCTVAMCWSGAWLSRPGSSACWTRRGAARVARW